MKLGKQADEKINISIKTDWVGYYWGSFYVELYADGEFVKINKTKAEKQEEARQRAIEEEAKKKVKKDRKKNKRKHQSGEDIDLFG